MRPTLAQSCHLLQQTFFSRQGAAAQVDYKAPLPAGSHILCTATLESSDGRKAWVRAEVLPHPGGPPYATGKALFVIPRDRMALAATKSGGPAADAANGEPAAATPGPPETECELERLTLAREQ